MRTSLKVFSHLFSCLCRSRNSWSEVKIREKKFLLHLYFSPRKLMSLFLLCLTSSFILKLIFLSSSFLDSLRNVVFFMHELSMLVSVNFLLREPLSPVVFVIFLLKSCFDRKWRVTFFSLLILQTFHADSIKEDAWSTLNCETQEDYRDLCRFLEEWILPWDFDKIHRETSSVKLSG